MPYGFNEDKSKYDLASLIFELGLLKMGKQDKIEVETAQTNFVSGFTNYTSGTNPHFVKFGKIVFCYGIAKPTQVFPAGQIEIPMFTIPSGYRPAGRIVSVMQGSARHLWTMELWTSGNATFSRLRGDTGGYIDAGTSEWLPFSFTYICQ